MKVPVDPSRDQRQLNLDLFRGIPWDGLSPRVLTRGFIPLFLRRKPPSHEVFFDREQLEIWPAEWPPRMKRPRVSSPGASLLLEPYQKRRGEHGTKKRIR